MLLRGLLIILCCCNQQPFSVVVCVATPKKIECPECDPNMCFPTDICSNGVAKKPCGCCYVCSRNEGESCGGIGSHIGTCASGFSCNVRHPNSKRNLYLPHGSKVGKCEPEQCKSLVCGMHEWCKLKENTSQPVCHCGIKCPDVRRTICDATGSEYKNICELRMEECKKQISIETAPCLSECLHIDLALGTISMMQLNEKRPTNRPCEERVCQTGSVLKQTLNHECLMLKGYTCSRGSKMHQDRNCEQGYFCRITKPVYNIANGYPHLGACTKLESNKCYKDGHVYTTNQRFVSQDCKGLCTCVGFNRLKCSPLCRYQPINCSQNQHVVYQLENVTDKCKCKKPTCMTNAEICQMKPQTGECYSIVPRWFYNYEQRTCERFNYGGCADGNRNNFVSKFDCQRFCCARNLLNMNGR